MLKNAIAGLIIFFVAVRCVVGKEPLTSAAERLPSKNVELAEAALAKMIDLDFQEQPLNEVVAFLKRSLGVNLVMDEKGLQDGGVAADSPITLNVCGVSCESAMTLILDPLELDFTIRDEVIWVSTKDRIATLLEQRVYDLSDLTDGDFDSIIDLVTTLVAPETWSEAGGPGSIASYSKEEKLCIAISQTRRVHRQIEKLLDELRAKTCPAAREKSSSQASSGVSSEKVTGAEWSSSANNHFACDLYGKLRQKQLGNFFFSPYSLFESTALLHRGASGETAAEIARTLHLSDSSAQGPTAGAARAPWVSEVGKSNRVTLHVASRLWGSDATSFHPLFLDAAKGSFGAELEVVNFRAPEATCKRINQWIDKETRSKIKEIISPANLNASEPYGGLVITNAIYFKGLWKTPFPSEPEFTMAFSTGSKEVDVAAMAQTAPHLYGKSDGMQILEKPYAGNELAMVFVLPAKTASTLGELEAELTAETLEEWLHRAKRRTVDLRIPKFTMTSSANLNETLKEMGVSRAFDSGRAEFAKISDMPLSISEVLHKATVEVNESGTEAAAASATLGTFGGPPPEMILFHADRPFLFLIRHRASKTILFMGRFVGP
jgi:serpin B